jgi:hypothetical protein
MSFERPVAGAGMGPEAIPVAREVEGGGSVSPSMRLQILSTEHWSLLASRSLAWGEMFSRASMYLTSLTGAIVALALVAQATEFGEGFRIFGLVVLPVVLFIGLTTLFRMGSTNYHDAQCVIGMNRIRAGYLEMAPDLERFFVMGATDDDPGIQKTMAFAPETPAIVHFLAGSPMVVMVINSVLVAAIVALAAIQLGADTPVTILAGAIGFLLMLVLQLEVGRRGIAAARGEHEPLFPSRTIDASTVAADDPSK